MILRKPYAFIIKHFKLIHLVLTILLAFSVYRLNMVASFLREYVANPVVINRYSVEDQISSSASNIIVEFANDLENLFPFYVFLLPLIIILVTLIVLFIIYSKKKPYLLYLIIILYSILMLAFYGIAYSITSDMYNGLPDVRLTNIIKDFFNIVVIAGAVLTAFVLVRATGFDIKKFNFVKDLQDLDISEEDSAEFEVELNIDSNVIRRNIRKKIRHLKYLYFEKKFLINLIGLSIIIVSGFIIYFGVMVHHKNYPQGAYFGSSDFNMKVNNVYLTNKDYLGNTITNNYLVIIDLNIKSSYSKGKRLDLSNCVLTIGDKEYKHNSKYRDLLFDIGNVYDDNLIDTNRTNYLLVYEIPASSINKKMIFRYTMSLDIFASSIREKYAKVKLAPINLDDNYKLETYEVSDTISLKSSIMNNLNITVNSYEISDLIAEYYRFCISTKECYDSVEYIVPTIGNVDKTILKINGKIENSTTKGINNLYNLIEKFGKIEYQINNNKKKTGIIGKLNPNHGGTDNYYLEIPKEIEDAEKISLKFNIRNKIYEYVLK